MKCKLGGALAATLGFGSDRSTSPCGRVGQGSATGAEAMRRPLRHERGLLWQGLAGGVASLRRPLRVSI
eukprot:4874712-Alexandrium_andersonii.AAC.1